MVDQFADQDNGGVAELLTDPDDPRLDDYRALTDLALRTRFEPPHGLFIAEGELVVRRALRAGYRMRSLLIDEKRAQQHHDLAPESAPVYAAAPPVLEKVTGFHVHRGVLASFHRRPGPSVEQLLAASQRLLIMEDINNHTNIGAVFRGAAGLGMDAVLLSPTCADPLYRRSIRVSMGEVFALPYAVLSPWPDGLDLVREAGFTVLALTPDPAATPIGSLRPEQRRKPALLFGAEGPGLSHAAVDTSDLAVRIPMSRGVDSLNVAAAAAVACFAVNLDM